MKSILTILVLTAIFAGGGFLVGYATASQQLVPPEPNWSNDMTTEQKEQSLEAGREQIKILVENKQARGAAAEKGAFIGAPLGFVVGLAITALRRRNKAAVQNPP
ncbi:MAG TPA: hypothetical protein VMJ32_12045 [Pirellulales bacterium]|nr:hypothetical protein [Pirellulales bacterium]